LSKDRLFIGSSLRSRGVGQLAYCVILFEIVSGLGAFMSTLFDGQELSFRRARTKHVVEGDCVVRYEGDRTMALSPALLDPP
jgi:hypothetical protein